MQLHWNACAGYMVYLPYCTCAYQELVFHCMQVKVARCISKFVLYECIFYSPGYRLFFPLPFEKHNSMVLLYIYRIQICLCDALRILVIGCNKVLVPGIWHGDKQCSMCMQILRDLISQRMHPQHLLLKLDLFPFYNECSLSFGMGEVSGHRNCKNAMASTCTLVLTVTTFKICANAAVQALHMARHTVAISGYCQNQLGR